MSEKIIDLNKTVYEITEEFPAVIDILCQVGLTDIKNPNLRKTAGRFVTIPKGAQMHHIELDTIKDELIKNGFTLK